MPETVPLRGLLRVEMVLIVERMVGFQPSDAMFEAFTAKAYYIYSISTFPPHGLFRKDKLVRTRRIQLLNIPIQAHSLPVLDLARGVGDNIRRENPEHPQSLIMRSSWRWPESSLVAKLFECLW